MQRLNGQTSPQPEHPKRKRHTAKLVPFAIRQRIINALANGDSIRSIARALHVSNNTVVVIRDEDWQQVAARKERIAAQAELNATLAAERITDKLQSRDDIPLNVLIPTFGVCVDKLLALRGDAALTIRHEHLHRLTRDDLVAFALERSKRAKAVALEVPALLPRDASARGENAAQKEG